MYGYVRSVKPEPTQKAAAKKRFVGVRTEIQYSFIRHWRTSVSSRGGVKAKRDHDWLYQIRLFGGSRARNWRFEHLFYEH